MKRAGYILYKGSELILRGEGKELELKVADISLGNGLNGNSSKTVYFLLMGDTERKLPPLVFDNGFRELGIDGFTAKVGKRFSHYQNRACVHFKSQKGYSTFLKWGKPVPEPISQILVEEKSPSFPRYFE